MRSLETNDCMAINNIIYQINSIEDSVTMRKNFLTQMGLILDFDSADFYIAEELIENPWLLGSPTFEGNPVCCSAALATIKYMLENDIPGQCKEKGEYLKAGLEKLLKKYPTVIDHVRGIGLMLAVEFCESDVGYSVPKGLFMRGVMTAGTLVNAKCIRFEPTAVISTEDMDDVIERMDLALEDTKRNLIYKYLNLEVLYSLI